MTDRSDPAASAARPAADPDATASREGEVIAAFVDLSNELVDGYDIVELLASLTTSCARLLDVASAGLLLSDAKGTLQLMAASSDAARHLELFQLQRDQGPCLDCYRAGEAVLVPDLSAETQRWPQFCQGASLAGFAAVHALPMRLRDNVLGTLGLFGAEPGRLDPEDLALAQALVHVASVAIVNEKVASDSATVNDQLQQALSSRIVVEQAKGVLAHSGRLEVAEAFTVLRRFARDHGRRISEVATRLVSRELDAEVLLRHARSVGILP